MRIVHVAGRRELSSFRAKSGVVVSLLAKLERMGGRTHAPQSLLAIVHRGALGCEFVQRDVVKHRRYLGLLLLPGERAHCSVEGRDGSSDWVTLENEAGHARIRFGVQAELAL